MILKELKEFFDAVPDDTVMDYGLSDVFSWRGSYDEVAFSIAEGVKASESKKLIKRAYNETFYGYKGGEYKYDDYTAVNFEECSERYSDGDYCQEIINKMVDWTTCDSQTIMVKNMIKRNI